MSHTTRPRSVVLLLAVVASAIAACTTAPAASPSPSPSPPASDPAPATPSAPADPDPTSRAPGDPTPSEPAAQDPEALLGLGWVLIRMEGVDLPPDAGITAAFGRDGGFGGSGGCNEYGGRYSVDGDTMTIDDVVSTLIGCDGVVGQREGSFFASLERVERWAVEGERLTLSGPEGAEPLVFQTATGEAALRARLWLLVEMGGQAIPADPPISARFGHDGSVDGSGGCNGFFGSYAVDGEAMDIGDVGSTKMACDGGIGTRESAFFAALAAVERWSIEDGRLILDGPEGADPLVFEPFAS